MRVAIGSDHAGFALKGDLCTLLDELRVEYRDFGTFSDEPDTLDADDVLIAFATQADLLAAVVDGGRVPGGVASTVLDLTTAPARMLREGPIGRDQLAPVVEIHP